MSVKRGLTILAVVTPQGKFIKNLPLTLTNLGRRLRLIPHPYLPRPKKREISSGGGGWGEIQKKYSRKRKLNEKNSCTSINPKKCSYCGLKKIHTKIPAARKFHFLPCPITFLMVRPLRLSWSRRRRETGLFGAEIRPGLAWWRKRE